MPKPAALFALAGAALLLTRKRSPKMLMVNTDALRRPYTEAEVHGIETSLDEAGESGGMPFFDGYPADILDGTNYDPEITKPIDMWVYNVNGKTYPDPRRFVQWNVVQAGNMTKQEFWDKYAFAVIENGSLNFYVLGAEAARNRCCQTIKCWKKTKTMENGKLVVREEYFSTDHGGHPPHIRQTLGEGWECHCYAAASACYSLIERPHTDWPRVQTRPPTPQSRIT
jgi:hypothetical protein